VTGFPKVLIPTLVLIMAGFLFLQSPIAQAGMVGTDDLLSQVERDHLVTLLERQDIQQELIAMGVDPAASALRVSQMTDEEVAMLQGRLDALPAGAALNTVDLLLIIIILLLLL